MHFFRKYQRVIFIILAFIIIVSFSFFGTYQAFIVSQEVKDDVAFTTSQGKKIRRSEVEAMENLLSVHEEIIQRDFLENGFGEVVFSLFAEDLKDEFHERLTKEKDYLSYVHEHIPFLTAEAVWKTFAPDIQKNLTLIKNSKHRSDEELFRAKINLFLAEKKFPATYLKDVLRYQEKQIGGDIFADPYLSYGDLSVFRYHTVEDWFGPSFLQIVSRIIINMADLAEAEGYEISLKEALTTFSQQKYGEKQLRMDRDSVIKTFQKILLFRKLLDVAGNILLVDPLMCKKCGDFENEEVMLDLYSSPLFLRFKGEWDFEKFVSYLEAIYKDKKEFIPKSIEQLQKTFPQLLKKRYLVELKEASIEKTALSIPLKQAWEWELEEENWKRLQEAFSSLKDTQSIEERFQILEELDMTIRKQIDLFARIQVLKAYPEKIDDALEKAPAEKREIILYADQMMPLLVGSTRLEELRNLLNTASVFKIWSDDQTTYYQIFCLEQSSLFEVCTFEEADRMGILARNDEKFFLNESEFKEYLSSYMQMNLKHLKENIALSTFLEKTQIRVKRDNRDDLPIEKIFEMDASDWSQVYFNQAGDPYFFQIVSKNLPSYSSSEWIEKNQKMMSKEAKCFAFSTLIQRMKNYVRPAK